MKQSRRKVHLDASKPGDEGRTSLCGMLFVNTETDVSLVTCALCLGAISKKTIADAPISRAELATYVAEAALGEPKAPPPPRLTAPMWARSCKGGEHRRCGDCDLCRWEREAAKWEHAAPDRHVQRSARSEPRATRWSSLTAALIALADWQRHDRNAKSASAGILARIEFGQIDGGPVRSGDPLLDAAGEFVLVRRVIEDACPAGAQATMTRAHCVALLLARTPGVEPEVPPYEALAERFAETVGNLRALVRNLRQRVTEQLAARGLIPAQRPMARRERGSTCQQSVTRF
jgi:hypothetical protein